MATINQKVIFWHRRNDEEEYYKRSVDKHSSTAQRIGRLYGLEPKSIVLEELNDPAAGDVIFAEDYAENVELPVKSDATYIVKGVSLSLPTTNVLQPTITNSTPVQTNATENVSEKIVSTVEIQASILLDDAADMDSKGDADIATEIDRINAKIKEIIGDQFKYINIPLIGKTGSGKSTLINALFGCDLADEGVGYPKTLKIIEYPRNDEEMNGPFRHIRLLDTRGIEVSNAYETINTVKKFLQNRNNTTDMSRHIHLALYTVLAASMRFEEVDVELINTMQKIGIYVIVVITKAIDEEEKMDQLQNCIHRECSNVNVVRVLAKKITIGDHSIDAFGLKELVKLIAEHIPEQCSSAFVAAQRVDSQLKGERARAIFLKLQLGAFVVSFLPAGGLVLSYFLCYFSEVVANLFNVSLDGWQDWSKVVKASGIYEMTHMKIASHIPFIGAIPGSVIASKYFEGLITALEQLHFDRHGDMNAISADDIVEVIKKIN